MDPKKSDGRGVAEGDVGGKVAVTAEAGRGQQRWKNEDLE